MVIDFLNTNDVCRIHQKVVAQYGGLPGVRDYNLLDSAIAQPQMFISGIYVHPDIFHMSAAYCFHIIKNNPFFDGNKRTGLLGALTFLNRNGVVIEADFDSLVNLAIEVACSNITKEQIAEFLKHSVSTRE